MMNHVLTRDPSHVHDGALLNSDVVMGALGAVGMIGIEGRRQLAVTAYHVRSFFDAHLKGPGRAPVRSPDYPEIEVLE